MTTIDSRTGRVIRETAGPRVQRRLAGSTAPAGTTSVPGTGMTAPMVPLGSTAPASGPVTVTISGSFPWWGWLVAGIATGFLAAKILPRVARALA